MSHKIQAKWLEWRKTLGVIGDRKVPTKLKGKCYCIVLLLAVLHHNEFQILKGQQEKKMSNKNEYAKMNG